jgi:hypothetical protein
MGCFARAVALVALVTLVGCGPADRSPTPPDATEAVDSPSPALPTDPATALLLGPWRPSPVELPDELRSSAEYVCRNPENPAVVAAMEDLPLAVADARGDGLASLIFADESVAFECRVKLEMVGAGLGATILAPPARLAPGDLPHDEITIVSDSRLEDDGGQRTILIGRVDPEPFRVVASFDDETEVVASHGNGWYTAWWPGLDRPGGVAAVDSRSLVVTSAPDPHAEVEGRATAATWWVEPNALPLPPDATTIPAMIEEEACSSGQSPEGRVLEPTIIPGETSVLVGVFVRRRPGGQDCQGTGPFPIEITLPEPLDGRRLLDASTVPPRDASKPPP